MLKSGAGIGPSGEGCVHVGRVALKGGSSSHICILAEQSARERLMQEGLRGTSGYGCKRGGDRGGGVYWEVGVQGAGGGESVGWNYRGD